MKRIRIALACCTLMAALGCGVEGKWSLSSVDPSVARKDFPYEVLTLQKDGSFYAESREGGARTASGTYRYEHNVLSFHEKSGALKTYDAKKDGNDKLKLEQPWQDRKLVATFQRENQ